MYENTCCFTGNRVISDDLDVMTAKIQRIIYNMYDRGFTNFVCGGALGFDTMVARQVIKLKRCCKEVKLILVLPCKDQAKKWNYGQRKEYREIKELADEVDILYEEYPGEFCFMERNKKMVDMSSMVVSYVRHAGGASKTLEYAKKQGKDVYEL